MRRVGVLSVTMLIVTLGLGGLLLQSCGDDEGGKREKEQCEICVDSVDQDCVRECRPFCLPTEDCEGRCTRQCDRCKADLRCQPCASGCTGTETRCAAVDAQVMCEDGTYGGSNPIP